MGSAERLIASMQELLWERGYSGTSPRAVQKMADVGQGSMYHHFQGKADLAVAAEHLMGRELQTQINERLTPARRPSTRSLPSSRSTNTSSEGVGSGDWSKTPRSHPTTSCEHRSRPCSCGFNRTSRPHSKTGAATVKSVPMRTSKLSPPPFSQCGKVLTSSLVLHNPKNRFERRPTG